ncbi:MAG: hypothetical protein Q8Q14_13505 [Gemmatimonadales bacterium]|nr:hypothetical protein [Gemmatimonadales bacterium]
MPNRLRLSRTAATLVVLAGSTASAQIVPERAEQYFREARMLCESEGGQLWGVSLCGPMVFADASSGAIATNRTPPDADRPRALGYANAAMTWGGERWSTFVWPMIPHDDQRSRARLMMHELFHRVQPDLGLLVRAAPGGADHLDTPEGRYWLQLEWRALARALVMAGAARTQAIGDALGFRHRRRQLGPDVAEIERISEVNEGLAQYTATVTVAETDHEARLAAVEQLRQAPEKESFVRTFAYSSGAAYGVLLDLYSPGWTRQFTATGNLGDLLKRVSGVAAASEVEIAAKRYGGSSLRVAEENREAEQQARIAELRARFVEGPVLRLPRGRDASFITTGVTPIPGVGTVFPQYRVNGPWGRLEASQVLVSQDGTVLTVPGPVTVTGSVASGDSWSVTISEGWTLRPGSRAGDLELVPKS